METMELLKSMQEKYKDREPVKITFRYSVQYKEIIMVYQETYAYNTEVKTCFTMNGGHSSIDKEFYQKETKCCKNVEDYISLLRYFLLNYPEDNYQIVNRIYWNK